jgi:hypothetical protein
VSGAPRAMVYGLFRDLPGVPGLVASVTRKKLASLISASGDQDHAASLVRADIARQAKPARPSHPIPTFVAIGQTPLQVEAGRAGSKHEFLKNGSSIFFDRRLDTSGKSVIRPFTGLRCISPIRILPIFVHIRTLPPGRWRPLGPWRCGCRLPLAHSHIVLLLRRAWCRTWRRT